VIHCLSPVERKVLWTRTLETRGQANGYYYSPNQQNIRPMQSGQSILSGQALTQRNSKTGMLAVANSNYVCVYGRRMFTVLDAATGKLRWTRHRVPAFTKLVGNEDVLYMVTQNRIESVAFRAADGKPLSVDDIGTLIVDTAYGGDSFVIVDAAALDFDLVESEARDLARLGVKITRAANAQLDFTHPENPQWDHFSFCLFAGPIVETATGLEARSAVTVQPGKIDRSPTGTAVSARMAVLHQRGRMTVNQKFTATSIIGSTFTGRIIGTTSVGDMRAVIPEISGRAWITGIHQHMLDPADPWPQGYRLSDTWGQS